jgi:hypothetical protein
MPTSTKHKAAALATEDIVIPQGADWQLSWGYSEDGVPVGWPDDWAGRSEVRASYGGALLASLHSGTFVDGEVVLDTFTDDDDVEQARVTLVLKGDVSADMTWQDTTGVYDVELVPPTPRGPVRFLEGKATLSAEASTDD